MRRFGARRQGFGGSANTNVLISVLLFLVVITGFVYAIGQTTMQTLKEQKQNLEAAVEQSLLQCYVIEGRYPENMDYLEEHYGISYDKEQFRVDYRVYGTNMRPEVDVVVLEGQN